MGPTASRDGTSDGAAAIEVRSPLVVAARLRVGDAVNLLTAERRPLSAFAGQPVLAVAAVGHPEAFFAALRASGIGLVPHPLPDHAVIKIDQDTTETNRVAAALQELIEQPDLRRRYGSAARQYAESTLTFSRVAQDYAGFMADCRAAIVKRVWA